MDRAALRRALAGKGQERAVLVMLERHACRLEQVADDAARREPEPLARALRAAQQLYDLDAVTVGDGGALLVRAAAGLGSEAASAVPARAVASRELAVAREAFQRLRTVLAGKAGVVVVLPAAGRLVAQAGLDAATAAATLVEAVRAFGEVEPDAFVLTGHDEEPDPTHDALADFYGAAMIRVGTWTTPGVAVREDLLPGEDPGASFLVTTPCEIAAGIEPAELRRRLAAAKGDERGASS